MTSNITSHAQQNLDASKSTTVETDTNPVSSSSNTQNDNDKDKDKSSKSMQKKKKPKSTFPFGMCKVCNDKATGVHYGISTCEGCKVIFNFN